MTEVWVAECGDNVDGLWQTKAVGRTREALVEKLKAMYDEHLEGCEWLPVRKDDYCDSITLRAHPIKGSRTGGDTLFWLVKCELED